MKIGGWCVQWDCAHFPNLIKCSLKVQFSTVQFFSSKKYEQTCCAIEQNEELLKCLPPHHLNGYKIVAYACNIIYDLRAARDVYRAAPALCFILLHFSQRGSSHLDSTHVLVTLFWRFIYVHVFFSKSSLGIIFETWCESKCFINIRWLKMKCSWFTLSFKRAIMINVPNYR